MPIGECIPQYEPGERITGRAFGAPVRAGRLVRLAAGGGGKLNGQVVNITEAAAPADPVIGVAGVDIGVFYALGQGFVVPMVAQAAVAVGARVDAGTAGRVATAGAGIRGV